MKKKLQKFTLKRMTCAELADWLEKPPAGDEHVAAMRLRKSLEWTGSTELLRKCGKLPVIYHKAYIKTARHLSSIPEISMMVGGGKPKIENLPAFSRSLKAMAEANGMPTIHRWGNGAFILKRKDQ